MWFKVSADKANKIDSKNDSAKHRCSWKIPELKGSAPNVFNSLNLRNDEFKMN
jgi:hypothetical protein